MKKLRWLLLVVLVMAVIAVAGLVWLGSFGEPALKSYVAKLRSQGERLTIDELAATYSVATNRTLAEMIDLVTALGPPPAEYTNLHLAEFVEPARPQVAWSLKQFEWMDGDRRTNISWADLEKRLTAAAPELHHLRQILEKPAPNGGRPTNYLESTIAWKETRAATTWLVCATLASLHERRLDDALVNLRALAGLANLHHEEFTLAQQMTRVAVADIALDLTWEALQATGWKEEQLAALQNGWQRRDLLAGLEIGLQGERTLPLEILSRIRQGKTPLPKLAPRASHGAYNVFANDALYGLRHVQTEVELVRQLQAGRPYPEIMEGFAKLKARLEAKSHSVTRYFYLISLICIPDYGKAVPRVALAETKRRLALTAMALRRYELKHGQPPQTLSALVPEFLPSVPRDCMDRATLKYQPNNDGTLTLYSVGTDGRDDGGDFKPVKAGGKTGLCEGADAVWPITPKTSGTRLSAQATP